MSSPWERPRLNRASSERRAANLRERFRRFGRRRVSRSLAGLIIGLLILGALALMQTMQPPLSQLGYLNPIEREDPSVREVARDGPFENCDAARAAGAAPVRRGQDGYGAHLDRDGDGIGCEPYPQ